MRVYVMRHAKTDENLKWIINDNPKRIVHLNSKGTKQSEEVAEKLRPKYFKAIFTSEFARAKETAEIVNKYHNAPVIIDPRLNERKTGFDGKHVSEFRKLINADRFDLKDRFNTKPPNGESWQEEKARISSFLKDLEGKDYRSVLVVTHGEVMQIMVGYFKKLSDEEIWDLEIDNCEVMEFTM